MSERFDADFFNVVDEVIGGATQIVQTIASVNDMNQRRNLETNLAFLDRKQQADLERELQATNNVNKRIEILVNAVSQIKSAQSSAILSSSIQAQALKKQAKLNREAQRERTLAIAIIGGSIVLFLGVLIIKKMR
jgi:hypothetical protein